MPDDAAGRPASDTSFMSATGEFDRWFVTEEAGGGAPGAERDADVAGPGLNQLSTRIQDLAHSLLETMAQQEHLLDAVGREAAKTAAAARMQLSKDAIAAVNRATSQYLEARAAADAVRHDLDKMLAVALEGACQIVADAQESAATLIEHARASVADITTGGEAPSVIDLRDPDGT